MVDGEIYFSLRFLFASQNFHRKILELLKLFRVLLPNTDRTMRELLTFCFFFLVSVSSSLSEPSSAESEDFRSVVNDDTTD